ncbi:MAG: hypothetical protein Q7S98_06040, partial [Deltaproteobacteria bacterium]|nr:hypothetical protein [Deltaproteobacteria bacterium]
ERLAMWASTSGYHAGIPALKRALKRSLQELQFERRKNKSKEPITADEVFATLITGGLLVGSYRGDSKDYPPQLWPAMKAAYGFTARERGENPDLRKQVPDLVVVNLDLINRPIPFDQLLGQVSTTNFQHHNDQYSNSWYERPTDSSLTGKARFIVLAGEEGRLSEWLIRNRYVSKAGIHLKKLGLPSKVAVLERSLTSSVEIPIPEPPRPVAKKEVAGK